MQKQLLDLVRWLQALPPIPKVLASAIIVVGALLLLWIIWSGPGAKGRQENASRASRPANPPRSDVEEDVPEGSLLRFVVSQSGRGEFRTIAEALKSGKRAITVDAGVYRENLRVYVNGTTIEGVGLSTTIDGGNSGPAITIDADGVTLRNLAARTNWGEGKTHPTVVLGDSEPVSGFVLESISLLEADDVGVYVGYRVPNDSTHELLESCSVIRAGS